MEKWEQVATHLNLTRTDINDIEHKAGRDVALMRMYMLQEWKKKKKLTGEATYRVLLTALLKCICSDTVIKICTLLQEEK